MMFLKNNIGSVVININCCHRDFSAKTDSKEYEFGKGSRNDILATKPWLNIN